MFELWVDKLKHPPSFERGPDLSPFYYNFKFQKHLFFFNISGNHDSKHVNLLGIVENTKLSKDRKGIFLCMLDQHKDCWDQNFTNHHKLTLPINDWDFGCDFMVKNLGFCVFKLI